MRTESTLLVIGFACAALLLLAPLSPRTTWVAADERAGSGGMRHSAGWDYVAPACALVAGACLVAGWFARPRVAPAMVAAVAAAIAFALAGGAAFGHWRDAVGGALDIPGYTTHPPFDAPFFALVGLVGAVAALALAAWWASPDH